MRGEPGTPEFIASYNEAIAAKAATPQGSAAVGVAELSEQRRIPRPRASARARDYVVKIKVIEAEFGDFPLSALTDRRTRGIFLAWRDKLAVKSRRQADYAWQVLARMLSWGLDRGLVLANPCARGGRLYRGSRRDNIWTADDEAAFLRSAPAHLHLPLLLALWTGQRQGDLLRLPWSAYDGTHIRLQAVQDRRARHDPGRRAAQGRARRCTETRAADPHQQLTAAVDLARLPDVVEHGREEGRNRRRDVPRSARHGGDAAGEGRLHRSRDRHHHRALAARRAFDPRRQLSASRCGARRERNPETRTRHMRTF